MKSKITYFMEKDTRIVVDNLTKVIVNENVLFINYTILRKNFKDEETTVIRYMRDKNRMIIYDELKKYNNNVYNSFIEWAEDKGIKWYSVGKVITDKKELENDRKK